MKDCLGNVLEEDTKINETKLKIETYYKGLKDKMQNIIGYTYYPNIQQFKFVILPYLDKLNKSNLIKK